MQQKKKARRLYPIHIIAIICFGLSFYWEGAFSQNHSVAIISDSLQKVAVNILKDNLKDLSGWNKVHAAEYLLWTGHPDNVRSLFLKENERYGKKPEYRIGVWRVLAQAAQYQKVKGKWIKKILDAFIDTAGPDRIHAAETLAKLRVSSLKDNPVITKEALMGDNITLSLYTRWSISYDSNDSLCSERKWFLNFLEVKNKDASDRRLVAYIIGKLGVLPVEDWRHLSKMALKEPDQSLAKIYLLSSAFITASKSMEHEGIFQSIKHELITLRKRPNKAERKELVIALAENGSQNDLPILLNLLNSKPHLLRDNDNADVRSAAAYAILRISKRESSR